VLLTTERPAPGSDGDSALRAAGRDVVFDVVDLRSPSDRARLATYAAGGGADQTS
jgi:hypothetical protein